jgi:hypothetical protein
MHAFPFGARITNSLLNILRVAEANTPAEQRGFVVRLGCHISFEDGQPLEHWTICALSRSYVLDEDIFSVDGVHFALAPEDQARAAGSVLDYIEGNGVVRTDEPKT